MMSSPISAGEQESVQYVNYYSCHFCKIKWIDRWDCACDDDCPYCYRSYSPYHSETFLMGKCKNVFSAVCTIPAWCYDIRVGPKSPLHIDYRRRERITKI